MKKLRHFLLSRLSSGETGQAFILVLIFLMLGSLTLVPTLTHISTALKTGEIYEENTDELYTADSGIEDSLWRIKYDFMGADYKPYDFETAWPYETEGLNQMTANFTIMNVWFPTDVNLDDLGLDADEAREMIESEKLVVAGSAPPGSDDYNIMISFSPSTGDNLTVKSLGVWLPRDFTYVPDSCTLQVDGEPYDPDHITVSEAPGGTTVLWSYDADYPLFTDFPGVDPEVLPMITVFTFNYTPPAEHPNWTPAAVAWITTDMNAGSLGYPNPNDVPVSWDIDTRYYKIVSEAGNTAIEAYSSKNELRQMGDAMSGDYVAIGNSLLSDDDGDDKRDDWHTPGSFNLTSIPSNADAVYAFLYWSGWRNENAIETVFSESCSDFDEWRRSDDELKSQTSYPSGDISRSGTWDKTTNMYTYVDEQGSNDGDTSYLLHGTTAGNVLFSFPAFNVPPGSVIQNLTIYLVARDESSGYNKIQPALRVGGTNYTDTNNPSVSTEVPTSYGTPVISYAYTYNPRRSGSSPWTADDINGIGSYALQGFGVRSADASPQIRLTQVYARVNYYSPSCWSISSSEFRGQGSSSASDAQRTLTLENGLDLDSYGEGIFGVSWDQDESGMDDEDVLYFAFSGDGGDNWSPNYKAFQGEDPDSPFWYTIPDDYVTDDFKIRFLQDANGSSDYAYLDNIEIVYLPVDTEITFKIGNDQVYFDGSQPADGPYPLTASRSYAMRNTMWGADYGFSYACIRDVSALVKKYPVDPDEEHHTGNAVYSVDGISADIRNPNNSLSDFAFAGWSLIIVYACPESAGHYIYIRDDNFAFHPGTGGNLDFDEDGDGGGTIRGFKIPNPITDEDGNIIETVAARLTCFIVEGDDFLNDSSSITITGYQSGLSKSLTNPSCEVNDVWNGRSYPGTFNEGVDVDTFELLWDDGILTPKDEELQVDLLSLNDAWNLVYFIISIRSETVTSGTPNYLIRGN